MAHCTCDRLGWIGKGHADECAVPQLEELEADNVKLRSHVRILRDALESARFEIKLRVEEDGGDDRSVAKACMSYDKALEATA